MRVLQLIDSLHSGGAERVSVNLANSLVNKLDKSFLCATREVGMLKDSLNTRVGFLFLKKKSSLDIQAIIRLNKFIKNERIDIIHAHSTSFFLASIIRVLNRKIKLVWHDHYGNSEFLHKRKSFVLKVFSKYFNVVFSVNDNLKKWAKNYLGIENVFYLPNFAVLDNDQPPVTELLGNENTRIICLANLRPQKDHINLIRAFKKVVDKYPKWTLHIVGKNFDDNYSILVKKEIDTFKLNSNIFLYGSKPDISNILNQCEIGLLSSLSEGLPLSLLEYGLANLAVIATRVGECETVIKSKKQGILIKPRDEKALSDAIMFLIENEPERQKMAKAYHECIKLQYSQDVITETVFNVYKKLISDK